MNTAMLKYNSWAFQRHWKYFDISFFHKITQFWKRKFFFENFTRIVYIFEYNFAISNNIKNLMTLWYFSENFRSSKKKICYNWLITAQYMADQSCRVRLTHVLLQRNFFIVLLLRVNAPQLFWSIFFMRKYEKFINPIMRIIHIESTEKDAVRIS